MKKITSVKILLNSIAAGGLLGLGYLIGKKQKKTKTVYFGSLRIDQSEKEEPPKIFLELTCNLEELSKHKDISLKVIKKNYVNA